MDDAMDVTWSASEYVAHQKDAGWYVLLMLGAAALAIAIYLITGDMFSGGVIVLVGIIFALGSSRQPRTLEYGIGRVGLKIGEKFYPYSDFKSFAVVEEDAIYSILLLPMKRFMPGVNLYYPPDQEDEIMGVLSSYLPHETRTDDMFDKLTRRLRF
jgi:hypothetical protein